MKNKKIENAKVGLFVLAGILFLVFTLYMIGKNKNLFGSKFILKSLVTNVNGLVPGNNVRFMGMDVGTVKSIEIANDTAILIVMVIEKRMKPYIKTNAVTSIGTDGLMGNKLIHIIPQEGPSEFIVEGDVLYSQIPVETSEMLRSLNITSNYIEKTSLNLYEITAKLNGSESLWALLSDTLITGDLRNAVAEFHKAGRNSSELTEAGKNLILKIEKGDGLAYKILTDTLLPQQLGTSLEQILQASQQASMMLEDLRIIVDNLGQGAGPAGLLLTDTLLRETIIKSALNVEQGTENFNQNMEALKRNFLFRRYFRRLEKRKLEQIKASDESR